MATSDEATGRPAVSVVMPFAGSASEAAHAVEQLEGLATLPGDELIIVDNSPAEVVGATRRVGVARAAELASSYYARNVGAGGTTAPWLLFVDSDCVLPPGLLDLYFDPAPAPNCGIVAGEVEGDPDQTSLVARYHRSRGHLHADVPLTTGPSPAVGTANALVRREVWEQLDGFEEVISGADFEFSWRAAEHRWAVEHRPEAQVRHLHPERVGAMRAKARRYGAGQRWLDRRYPGAPRPPGLLRELVRGGAGLVGFTLAGQAERGRFKALDAIWIAAYTNGWRRGKNEPEKLKV